jgi:hypothetical protein
LLRKKTFSAISPLRHTMRWALILRSFMAVTIPVMSYSSSGEQKQRQKKKNKNKKEKTEDEESQ